jgi:hypothetical protein
MSTVKSPDKILVGIVGHAGSGKDTVADLLKNYFPGYRPYKCSFSELMASELARITGGQVETIMGNKDKEPLVRKVLQFLGEDTGWLDTIAKLYKAILIKTLFVIPNCRYPRDVDWIKEQGGVVIRVFRPLADLRVGNHPSETEVDKCKFDWGIRNDGSLRDLERDVKWTSQFIKEKYKIV